MKGRPRKPTKVLEMTGAFRTHPERRRAREGEPEVTEPLGPPPDCLDEAERARWAEVSEWCPWLGPPDRFLVESTCRLIMLDRRGKSKSPDRAQLANNLARLGMNPADRTRLKMPAAKPPGDPKRRRFFGKKVG